MEEQKLRELIRDTFSENLVKKGEIPDDADLYTELGGDSLDMMNVHLDLEQALGMKLPQEEFRRCRTVNDVLAFVQAKRKL